MVEPSGESVAVVSGLPRSGTSMMMRMIVAGGVPALADEHRTADEDNPLGYFEFEAVKATRSDPSWLAEASGKVVKVVHVLLVELPPCFRYRVVMMHRNLDEVVESQRKMLARSGKTGGAISADALKRAFAAQLEGVLRWASEQPNFQVLAVNYQDVIADPRGQAGRVAAFLGIPEAAERMSAAVDPALYRNRS